MFKKKLFFMGVGALAFLSGSEEKLSTYLTRENFRDTADFDNINSPKVSRKLCAVLVDMKSFCELHKQEFIMTDFLSSLFEDQVLHRVSDTHSTGRAADLRIMNWPGWFRILFLKRYNSESELRLLGALSPSTGRPALVVDESAKIAGPHYHVQVSY
ncbi:MAG: hypothetical protein PHN88_16180 [Ignavibacteria bacterium]|nr:hypothetical protein [Ignavibacteria bacterium]